MIKQVVCFSVFFLLLLTCPMVFAQDENGIAFTPMGLWEKLREMDAIHGRGVRVNCTWSTNYQRKGIVLAYDSTLAYQQVDAANPKSRMVAQTLALREVQVVDHDAFRSEIGTILKSAGGLSTTLVNRISVPYSDLLLSTPLIAARSTINQRYLIAESGEPIVVATGENRSMAGSRTWDVSGDARMNTLVTGRGYSTLLGSVHEVQPGPRGMVYLFGAGPDGANGGGAPLKLLIDIRNDFLVRSAIFSPPEGSSSHDPKKVIGTLGLFEGAELAYPSDARICIPNPDGEAPRYIVVTVSEMKFDNRDTSEIFAETEAAILPPYQSPRAGESLVTFVDYRSGTPIRQEVTFD